MKKNIILLLAIATLIPGQIFSQTKMPEPFCSKYVEISNNGELTYHADEKGNTIPDFSRVGYHHQDIQWKHYPATIELSPLEGDNREQIQNAIDQIASLPQDNDGHRGTLLLKEGIFNVYGTINITASGIVVRGEGQNGNRTHLIATKRDRHPLFFVTGKGNPKETPDTRVRITDDYVPCGTHSFHVADASGFKAGDRIMVYRPGTKEWIHDLRMDQIVERKGTKQWSPGQYNLAFERQIEKIEGNLVFIDNPIVMEMSKEYGGGFIYKYTFDGRISEIGFEDLYMESEFDHYQDMNHGWTAIEIDRAEDCWVSNITARYFGYSCVFLNKQSKNVTVINCYSLEPKSIITGGDRYSFNNNGQQNLFMNCHATEGRHDFVTGAQTKGPNVFYNCTASQTYADIGPHHRWATGTLYDNIVTDGQINVQDRGYMGSGHGWSGVNQVIWNCKARSAAIQSPWVSGKNYCIGLKGDQVEGAYKGRPAGEWEGRGETNVRPRSLFLAQLYQREKISINKMNK